MSVSTILNWNFQSIGEKIQLIGIIQVGSYNKFKSIPEDNIELIETTPIGFFIKTADSDLFCKYSDIGIIKSSVELDSQKFPIITEICKFERNFLCNPQIMKEIACLTRLPRNMEELLNLKLDGRIEKLLLKGLCKKIIKLNSELKNATCRVYLHNDTISNSVVLKMYGHVFSDEYAKIKLRGKSCRLSYVLQDFTFSYLMSGADIILVNVPEDVREIQFIPCNMCKEFNILQKDGTSVKIRSSHVSIKRENVI